MTNTKTEVLKNMKFSYSNVSTFETCAYAWKLTYIDKVERLGNYYSDYGNLCHSILEKYFKKELEIYELLPYYEKHYNEYINSIEPIVFGKNLAPQYFEQGYKFFENFDFDRDLYDVLESEEFTITVFGDIKVTVKPDMLMQNKNTGKIILLDFKSSNPYDQKGRLVVSKIAGYKKQLNLYAQVIWQEKGIKIDEMWLWFFRTGGIEKFSVNVSEITKDIIWFLDVVEQIKIEKDFKANTNNKFFCSSLCSFGLICPYRE